MKRNAWILVLILSCICMAAPVPPAAADDPPHASFYVVCVPHRLCAVDAEASSDDGYITNYFWNWGDGTSTNGTRSDPSHVYAAAGIYTITLTITDNASQTDFTSIQVQVPN
jgi:hypothetical protein